MKVFYIVCISILIEKITPHHDHVLQHNTSIKKLELQAHIQSPTGNKDNTMSR